MSIRYLSITLSFFFNDTAPTVIYTLSLHDALPIYQARLGRSVIALSRIARGAHHRADIDDTAVAAAHHVLHGGPRRSEEHTSELQSQFHLVCRLLLEKKK